MDISKVTLTGIRINKIEYDAEELYELSDLQVGVQLSLAVNTDDFSILRLDGTFEVIDCDSELKFLILNYSAIFESDNDSLETEFTDIPREIINKMLASIIEEVRPLIEDITDKSFIEPVSIHGITLPNDEAEKSIKKEDS